MKTLLTLLFCLAVLVASAQDWPRNPTTGKVEFRGVMPWPASAKTEAQRKALVRQWYLKRLTDESPQAVAEATRTAVSPAVLTYAGLPIAVAIGNASHPSPGVLAYIVTLRAGAGGLAYKLTEFDFSREGGVSDAPATDLEQALATDSPETRPALAALRKRLTAAVAGW